MLSEGILVYVREIKKIRTKVAFHNFLDLKLRFNILTPLRKIMTTDNYLAGEHFLRLV